MKPLLKTPEELEIFPRQKSKCKNEQRAITKARLLMDGRRRGLYLTMCVV